MPVAMVNAPEAGAAANINVAIADLLNGRNTKWYKGRLGLLNLYLFFLLITQMNNGYDGSMMNGLQTLDTWKDYFHNPQGGKLGVFNAIQTIGGLSSLLASPYMADWVGRRYCLIFGLIFMLIGTAVQSAAQNVGMFIGCRFLIGFGLSFAGLAAPLLIGELAFPTHRGILTSLWGPSWNMGAIVAAWTTFGTFRIASTWSWRIPSLLQGVPGIFQLCIIWFIPESPRWLVSKGRDEQALKVLTKWHCNGDHTDPLVAFEYEEIKESIKTEREAKNTSSYLSLFKTPGNRRRMRIIIPMAFFSQWSGSGLVSYYLTLVLDGIGIKATGDQTLINGILQVWGFGVSILGSLLVDRAGRRLLMLISVGGMCICFVCWTICSALYTESAKDVNAAGDPIHPDYSAGHAVLAFIILYNACYAIGMSPVQNLYDIEICPTQIRAKALTIGSLSINIALIFNQYVNPIALGKLNWKYYIIYDVWLVFEFTYMFFFMVETLGPEGPLPLEETIFLYDDPIRMRKVMKGGRKAYFPEPVLSDVAPAVIGEKLAMQDDKAAEFAHVDHLGGPGATQ